METILFSIVLPTYNRGHLISRAIDSIIAQSYTNWELIIVDDGSTDSTFNVVSDFKDIRIKYHKQKNKGKGPARNAGVQISRGDFICFLDSDDTYKITHLRHMYEGIKNNPSYGILRTGAIRYNNAGILDYQTNYLPNEDKVEQLKFVWMDSFFLLDLSIEASLAKSIQSANCKLWQDKHYILRLVLNNPIKQLPYKTVIINEHDGRSVNTSLLNKELRNAPYSCMNALVESAPEIKQLLGERFIENAMVFSKFSQIYNLIALKQFKIAFGYFFNTLFNHPSFYSMQRSLVLIYRLVERVGLSLLGKKGPYF